MRKYITVGFLLLQATAFAQKANVAFQQKVTVLKRFMDKNHYHPLKWNDTASALLYEHWIALLDDDKIYFTKNDIAVLDQYKKSTSGINVNGKDFFNLSVDLYRKRLREADSISNIYLSKPIDFLKPDQIRLPAADFPADTKEQQARLQHYLKYCIIDNIADKMTADGKNMPETLPADFSKTESEERLRIRKRETNLFAIKLQSPEEFRKDMEDDFLDAMAWCYDPHSNYMNLRVKQQFDADVSAEEFTAGFTLEKDDKGNILIDYLQPGGSAWKSGQVHKGDELLKVKTEKQEYDVADLSEEEVEGLLGQNGSLEITIKTIAGEEKKVKLAQEKITDEESVVKSYLLKADKNYGYISLPGFYSREEEDEKKANYEGCAKDVSREIIKLKKDNISGLIIDLRNNGGGSMWEAIQLAGIFIDAGPVASVKDKDGKVQFMKDPNRGTIYDGPMIILINGRSASASEFFAAAMQDYNRALIVGGTTYGKGTAQAVEVMDTLANGSPKDHTDFIKVTGLKFYRVNGSTVQWKGVEPDIALPDLYTPSEQRERKNASALLPDQSKVGYYQPLPVLPIPALLQKSTARVSSDAYFTGINVLIKKMDGMQNGMDIPLQWAEYGTFRQNLLSGPQPEKDLTAKTLVVTDNNSYDKEKISLSAQQDKDVNAEFLRRLSHSHEVSESVKILEDIINNK